MLVAGEYPSSIGKMFSFLDKASTHGFVDTLLMRVDELEEHTPRTRLAVSQVAVWLSTQVDRVLQVGASQLDSAPARGSSAQQTGVAPGRRALRGLCIGVLALLFDGSGDMILWDNWRATHCTLGTEPGARRTATSGWGASAPAGDGIVRFG